MTSSIQPTSRCFFGPGARATERIVATNGARGTKRRDRHADAKWGRPSSTGRRATFRCGAIPGLRHAPTERSKNVDAADLRPRNRRPFTNRNGMAHEHAEKSKGSHESVKETCSLGPTGVTKQEHGEIVVRRFTATEVGQCCDQRRNDAFRLRRVE